MMQTTNTRAKAPRGIAEMMMRSDAPVALGSSLERAVLTSYQTALGAFRSYARVDSVPDLREVQSLRLDTHDELDPLGERDEYKDGKFQEKSASWKVEKFGKILSITKEMRLNDDTRAVFNLAQQYGQIAARTEAKVAPDLLATLPVTADGSGNISGPLNEALIERMFNVFWTRETAEGKKIEVDPSRLVFHPLHTLALQKIFRPSSAGDYNPIGGWLGSEDMIRERYQATNRLYLLAAPTEYPVVEIDFLRSRLDPREDYTNGPRIVPDSVNTLSFLPGDIGAAGQGFRYDTMSFKVTHFLGGALIDPDNLGIVVAEITA